MSALRHLNLDAAMPWLGSIVVVLVGALVFPNFLSLDYLLTQTQIAAFLGVLAAGAMVVILLGHIDLSVPWTLGWAAIVSTTLAGTGDPLWQALAIPAALTVGALIGVVNGVGVALFRIPSMVWTLAVNAILLGSSVLFTGGFNPKGEASPLMSALATGRSLGVPNAFLVWIALSVLLLWLLHRTHLGRYLIAIGHSEKASWLSGVGTVSVTFTAFVIAGLCSALGGVLLAGYANQAYQSMGDPYLMPVIAAVVIGGTSILGGRGSYLGTVGGALFITLVTSVLSVMQIGEAYRQIVFGGIIIVMLVVQNLRRREART